MDHDAGAPGRLYHRVGIADVSLDEGEVAFGSAQAFHVGLCS